MKRTIRMLRNVFVDGQPLLAGQVVSLPHNLADALVTMQRAERVQEQPAGDGLEVAAQPDPETPAAEGKAHKTNKQRSG